jgi:hypothetical protein
LPPRFARAAQPEGDGYGTWTSMLEDDVAVVLWYISQRWFGFEKRCPLTYVVTVVSKVDENKSKEESDLIDLAWKSEVEVS